MSELGKSGSLLTGIYMRMGLVLFYGLILLVPQFSWGAFTSESSGLTATATGAFGSAELGESDIGAYIGTNLIKPILGLTGVAFLCLTVYAGVLWLSSRGEDKSIKKAKDILQTAIIGTVILASAYVITDFVIDN
ncbi:MAG: hypothetical protein AAB833_00915, partial [Patescibacteria group bacterium]